MDTWNHDLQFFIIQQPFFAVFSGDCFCELLQLAFSRKNVKMITALTSHGDKFQLSNQTLIKSLFDHLDDDLLDDLLGVEDKSEKMIELLGRLYHTAGSTIIAERLQPFAVAETSPDNQQGDVIPNQIH